MHECTSFLYCVFDRISGELSHFNLSENDGVACRKVISTLRKHFDDCQLLCLGEVSKRFDAIEYATQQEKLSYRDVVHKFDLYPAVRVVAWTSWKAPETEAEALAPLGLSNDEVRQIVEQKQKQMNINR